MTTRYNSAFPRRDAPEFCVNHPSEIQRAGAQCARSLACKIKCAYERSHHGHTGITRHSLRNGFNGFLRALCVRTCLPPSSSGVASANLTPASGRQDHTTSPSASTRPRLWRRLRPPHPASYVRDDRETPLVGSGTARVIEVIWVRRETDYFCKGDWTTQITLIRLNKSGF
jgi:hypothetical protein